MRDAGVAQQPSRGSIEIFVPAEPADLGGVGNQHGCEWQQHLQQVRGGARVQKAGTTTGAENGIDHRRHLEPPYPAGQKGELGGGADKTDLDGGDRAIGEQAVCLLLQQFRSGRIDMPHVVGVLRGEGGN